MYRIGQQEADAVADLMEDVAKLFRYRKESQCERFESRWCDYVGAKHARLTASGTHALTAAMKGLGIGPGDEVLVPACTYMASAVAVLGVGAIPVVVDIDETTTMDPAAADDAVGPRTRAIMPVHMWGLSCDMDAMVRVAQKHNLWLIEDACQAVGGCFEGRMLGSFGHVGAYSFNYFKHISCGEGGCFVSNDPAIFHRADCGVDCCRFYWEDSAAGSHGYASDSARASEFEGAILNVQLDRLPDMIDTMRSHKKRILKETQGSVRAAPCHSLDHECGASVLFSLDTADQAERFAEQAGGGVLINTGRHVYTAWDPILNHHGAHHPALDPFKLDENKDCRMNYTVDMCARSLDILRRTVNVKMHPDHTEQQITDLIAQVKSAAEAVKAVGAKQ